MINLSSQISRLFLVIEPDYGLGKTSTSLGSPDFGGPQKFGRLQGAVLLPYMSYKPLSQASGYEFQAFCKYGCKYGPVFDCVLKLVKAGMYLDACSIATKSFVFLHLTLSISHSENNPFRFFFERINQLVFQFAYRPDNIATKVREKKSYRIFFLYSKCAFIVSCTFKQ